MLKFDDILLLLDKLNNQPEEKSRSGGAIICIKVKMKPWMGYPMGLRCGIHVVREPPKYGCSTQGNWVFTKLYHHQANIHLLLPLIICSSISHL